MVLELKKKIAEQPSVKFFIKRGEICCEEDNIEVAVSSEQTDMVEQETNCPKLPQWRPPHLKKPPKPIRRVTSDSDIDSDF